MTENKSETRTAGRPRTSADGNAKTKKLTIYITPSLDANIAILAGIEGLSISELIARIIGHEISERADEIEQTKKNRRYS